MEQPATDPVSAAANVMARQKTAALLRKDYGQLSSVNETLKKQNAGEKLKRTPSVQEKVRTNDSVAMILAKIYAITKREQELNIIYRKNQNKVTKESTTSIIKTLKSTSSSIKKSIDNLTKINEENLEQIKITEENQKLFEEEKLQDEKNLEERRHKELLEAIKGEKETKEPKDQKESWLMKLLGPLLTGIVTKFGNAIFKMLPKNLKFLIKGFGILAKTFIHGIQTLLPKAIGVILANPIAALAAAIGLLSLKLGSDYKEIEENIKKATDAGDVKTMREGLNIYAERIYDEGGGSISVDDMIEKRLEASKTPEAKQALIKFREEKEKEKEKEAPVESEDVVLGKIMAEQGYQQAGGALGSKKTYKDIKTGKEVTPEVMDAARKKAKEKTSERQKSSLPVDKAKLTSQYGGRVNPVTKKYQTLHNGVDLAMPVGTEVRAISSGEITVAKITNNVSGRTIRIKHDDGTGSGYAHLSALNVKVGQKVKQGDVIGYSGGDPKKDPEGAGASTGPHLHLVTYDKEGNAIDPKTVIPELASAKTGNYVTAAKEDVENDVMLTSEPTAIPEMQDLESYEREVAAEFAEEKEEKPTLFGSIMQDMKSQMELFKKFADPNELEKLKSETENMLTEISKPSNITEQVSVMTDMQKMFSELNDQKAATNVTMINNTSLAKGGGGGAGVVLPSATVHDNNPSVLAGLYGIHNTYT